MELASPSPDEPVTQIEADVPVEPLALHADATDLDLELHSYERPLAVSSFGTTEFWAELSPGFSAYRDWVRIFHPTLVP